MLILISEESNYITSPFFVTFFAEYSNHINQKKNKINRKQETARRLLDEFVKEVEVSCQGEERSILGRPGQRAEHKRIVVVKVLSYRISKGGKRTEK